MALILVDVDDFKAYNDHYGHPAGDAALRQLGVVLRQGARRPLDIAARLGGEEFAVLLYDSEEGNTLAIAERLRQAVEALGIEHLGSSAGPCLTISLGVAYSTSGMGLDALYREADRALYEAKDAGAQRGARGVPAARPPRIENEKRRPWALVVWSGSALAGHTPVLQVVAVVAEFFACLLQQAGKLLRIGVGGARNARTAQQAGAGAIDYGQAQAAVTA